MSSFTPGPWVASQYLDNGQWGILRDPKNDDIWDGGEIVVGVSSRITEANAHLIACAPDLLKACHMFCSTLAFTPSSIPGAIETDLKAAYDFARETIARAEGRELKEQS